MKMKSDCSRGCEEVDIKIARSGEDGMRCWVRDMRRLITVDEPDSLYSNPLPRDSTRDPSCVGRGSIAGFEHHFAGNLKYVLPA